MAKRVTQSKSRSTATKAAARSTTSKAKPKIVVAATLDSDVGQDVAKPTKAPVSETPVVLKRKELFDRIAERSGAKKSDVRTVAEATLAEIGEALSKGEELTLPPLGKVMIVRTADRESAQIIVVKIRRPKPGAGSAGGVSKSTDADDGDDN